AYVSPSFYNSIMKMKAKRAILWLLIIGLSLSPFIFAHYHPLPTTFKTISSTDENNSTTGNNTCPLCDLQTALLSLCLFISFCIFTCFLSSPYFLFPLSPAEEEHRKSYSIRAPPTLTL
ncbi:MAG: hypothetical protein ACP5KZ_07935, partial [bacterium]